MRYDEKCRIRKKNRNMQERKVDCFIKKKETEMKQFRNEMKLSDAYPSNKVSDGRDTRGFNYTQCYM